MNEAAIAAAAAIAGGVVTQIINLVSARMFGIGPLQDRLVETLQKTVDAQADQIKALTADLNHEREERRNLETRVSNLESALEICYGRLLKARSGNGDLAAIEAALEDRIHQEGE